MTVPIRIVSDGSSFAELEPFWREFESACSTMVPFFRWDWLRQWWNDYREPGDDLYIVLAERPGKIVAALPTYIRTVRQYGIASRVLRFLGTGEREDEEVKSEFGTVFVRDDEDLPIVDRVLAEVFRNIGVWDTAVLNDVIGSDAMAERLRELAAARVCVVTETRTAERFPVALDPQRAYRPQSASLAMRLEQCRRHLDAHASPWSIESAAPDEANTVFDALVEHHQRTWTARGRTGAFASQRFVDFHRRVVQQWLATGNAELLVLRAKSEILGVLYLLVAGNGAYFYQSGFATSRHNHLRPGLLLHREAIDRSIASGRVLYDFMGGQPGTYKESFVAPGPSLLTIQVFHNRPRSRWLRAAGNIRQSLGSMRARMRRGSGAH